MLRITHSGSRYLTTVDLEGKLLGPWVDEVRTIVATLGHTDAMRLNLEQLSFADASGIELLQELRHGGVELFGCSPLIAGLLAAHDRPSADTHESSRAP